MVVGGKQSVKKKSGGLRVKTQSKGEESEGVETEHGGKRERGDWEETECMQTLTFQRCSERGLQSPYIPTQITALYLQENEYVLECE